MARANIGNKVILRVDAEGTGYPIVKTPGDFLVFAFQHQVKWPGLAIIDPEVRGVDRDGDEIVLSDEKQVAGVEMDWSGTPLAREYMVDRTWYWPATRDYNRYNGHAPRFRKLADALVESVRINGDAAYVFARRTGDFQSVVWAGMQVRDRGWFDNDDYVKKGAVERWWKAWFAKAKVSAPVLWKGSDDPMHW